MGRWRPPAEGSSPYITRRGFDALRVEYDDLWRVRRPAVVKALAEAAAEGDRSENAEYQYRKKELREIDRRVRYLQTRIPKLVVVEAKPGDLEKVYFGGYVSLENTESGKEVEYQIVGADEVDVSHLRISVDAPLAKGLLGKTVGDCVRIAIEGAPEYEILAVRYL